MTFLLPVADQVYGDQEMHSVVRNQCMDYMVMLSGLGLFVQLSVHYTYMYACFHKSSVHCVKCAISAPTTW